MISCTIGGSTITINSGNSGTININSGNSSTITINGSNKTLQPVLSDLDKYRAEMKAWNYLYSAAFKYRKHVFAVIKPDNTEIKKRNGKPLTYLAEFRSGLQPENSNHNFYFDQKIREKILEFLAPDSINPLKIQSRLNLLRKRHS